MYLRFIKTSLIALSLLFIPFFAMRFTDQISWSFFDFVIMGFMLIVYSFAIAYSFNKLYGSKKSLLIIIVGLLFLLLWAELAVGIFNSPFAGN